MLDPAKAAFAREMVTAAQSSEHIWPGYAAAEACLESAWGASKLCLRARNVFGLKTPSTWEGATISIPTREFLKGVWVDGVAAVWPVFDTYPQAFTERMAVLKRLEIYAEALDAPTGEDFVTAVSKHWATDPDRGNKVLQIYHAHGDIFNVTAVEA